MKKILLPHLGVNDESCVIVSWEYEENVFIEKETIICHVETTKTVIEVNSAYSGYLKKLAEVGDEIYFDKPVALMLDSLDEKYDFNNNDVNEENSEDDFERIVEELNCTRKAYEYSLKHNINLSTLNQLDYESKNRSPQFCLRVSKTRNYLTRKSKKLRKKI